MFKKNGVTARLYAIIIAAVAVFRYGCGADYFSYYLLYDKMRPSVFAEIINPSEVQEVGFRVIGAFFKSLNLPYEVFSAFFALITIYFIYKIAVKYSKSPTLSLVIYYTCYYFVWTYSSIRQGVVMAVGIYYLLEVIHDKKYKKFFIITLLLSSIHLSAFVLIGFFFVSEMNLNRSKLMLLSALAIAASILPLGGMILSVIKYVPFLSRFSYYIEPSSSFNNILDFQTIGRLMFMVIAFTFYGRYAAQSEADRKIMNIYIFSFIVYFVLKFSELTAARIAVYGKLLDIVILANILYVIRYKWNKWLYILCLVGLMSIYMVKDMAVMETQAGLIDSRRYSTPYTNIFYKDNSMFDNGFVDKIFHDADDLY